MKAFQRSMDLVGNARFRDYEFYVMVCKAPDNGPTDNIWLAYIPDLDICTEGFGRSDAYEMARDAGSMMLDDSEPWKRPGSGMLAAEAYEKTYAEFPDIDKAAWEHQAIQMEIPYRHWRDRK